jgi:peroxiredoxin Q/BCP
MKKILIPLLSYLLISIAFASDDQKVGDRAILFKLKTQNGTEFDLASRKGQWTVLYFFPKAETPGCTKQACAFRDNIKKIRALKAEVFGISTNNVLEQAEFAKNHNLNFTLLADDKTEVTKAYGVKMAVVNYSKRWTYIIDPDLIIREITKDVDPITDAERVAKKIADLQAGK